MTLSGRTSAWSERVLGADHPSTLQPRVNLASAYVDAGQLSMAIPLFERALADSERVLGADHTFTEAARNKAAEATATLMGKRQDDAQ